jgi:hypothetical protein
MVTIDSILEKLITLSKNYEDTNIDLSEVVEDMKIFVLENNKSSTS